jgi:hypothetical protein
MQDTKLQPVVQTPAWIGIAIWPLIAAVVGLFALNVATLTNDKVHSTGYSMLERVLGVALSAAALGDFLANSPSKKQRTLSNEHADLQAKHKKLAVDHNGLKAQSMNRANVARAASKRIGPKVVAVAARGVSTVLPRSLPLTCAVVTGTVLALDILDLCETMKALDELDVAFEQAPTGQGKVCGLAVPKWN